MQASRGIAVLAILLLVAGCASSRGDDEQTTDFDVTIDQTNEPVISADQDAIDVRYRIGVKNQTAAPVTLRRINLSSIGSAPLQLAGTNRQFDQVIAPGASETVEFWATAAVTDFTRSNRMPLTVRVRMVFRDDGGKDRTETFTRRVDAEYTWVGR